MGPIQKEHIYQTFTAQSSLMILAMLGLVGWFVASIWTGSGLFASTEALTLFNNASNTWYPFLILVPPILGSVAQLFMKNYSLHVQDFVVITMSVITIPMIMVLYPYVIEGSVGIAFPDLLGWGISFKIDMLGFILLLITSVVWFLVMVYAHQYMKREHHHARFFFFMGLSYAAVLGMGMAGDLFTLFLFFEGLTFASYMLVVHGQTKESFAAGYAFIFMGIMGGLLIFEAMVYLQNYVGSLAFESALAALVPKGNVRYRIMGFLIAGFSVKAGMAPVHVWLTRSHPVAPAPASALLSGVMIKVGAFAVVRVATSFFFPEPGIIYSTLDPVWLTSRNVGLLIIWVGVFTMGYGIFYALIQSNMKRMLAYSSISQMGFIFLGIGVALYLSSYGAMGYAGALYHIFNHGLYKSLLFMAAGSVYLQTHELDMYKLGGLWRKMPLTAGLALIGSLGIAGVPFFNGFASKSVLHHAIVEAYQYGAPSFQIAEWLFILFSMGTAATFMKFFYLVFLGKLPEKYKKIHPRLRSLHFPMMALAIFIVFIGLFPNFLLDFLIIPALLRTSYDPAFIAKYISSLEFFTLKEFSLSALILSGGLFVTIIGLKTRILSYEPPQWLRFEYIIFYPVNLILLALSKLIYGKESSTHQQELKKLEVKGNFKVGVLERITLTTTAFNQRFENTIISGDSVIFLSMMIVITGFFLLF
jgi:hydrogenase-4 component B